MVEQPGSLSSRVSVGLTTIQRSSIFTVGPSSLWSVAGGEASSPGRPFPLEYFVWLEGPQSQASVTLWHQLLRAQEWPVSFGGVTVRSLRGPRPWSVTHHPLTTGVSSPPTGAQPWQRVPEAAKVIVPKNDLLLSHTRVLTMPPSLREGCVGEVTSELGCEGWGGVLTQRRGAQTLQVDGAAPAQAWVCGTARCL